MHHAVDPSLRKRVAGTNVVGERASKRTRSPRPLTASPALSPPVVDVVEEGGWFAEERTNTHASLGSVPTHDSWREEDLPAAGVAEHAGRSEGRTGACVLRESQSEDTVFVAPVEDS